VTGRRSAHNPANWRLYGITDVNLSHGKTHVQVAEQLIAGGVDVIQFREKSADIDLQVETATRIKAIARAAVIPFIVNDVVEVALQSKADGFHVGQSDTPATEARQMIGREMMLGVSATNIDEAIRAEQEGADYIGFGPVYEARGTKPDTLAPIGLSALRDVVNKCRIPVIAIGGISHQNVVEVLRSGVAGVAVISALVAADDIAKSTREMKTIITSVMGKMK
jgi:thiamine-phosphate pyrophosphorylase